MDTVFLFASLLILLVTIFKLFFTIRWHASQIYILIALVCMLHISVLQNLYIQNLFFSVPHLYKTGALATYILVPAVYLYAVKILHSSDFKRSDLILFIPAFLYLIDYLPFFLKETEYKAIQMTEDINSARMNEFRQSWFMPPGFHFIAQNAYGVLMAFVMFFRIRIAKMKGGNSFYRSNKLLLNWFYVWSFSLFMAFMPDLMLGLTGYKPMIFRNWYLSPCLFLNYLYPVSILISPTLLSGIRGVWMVPGNENLNLRPLLDPEIAESSVTCLSDETKDKRNTSFSDPDTDHTNSNTRIYYAPERAEQIKELLDHHMLTHKSYLDPEYNIHMLAKDTGHSWRLISSLLNSAYGITFKDYVNGYRVRYFIDRYLHDPEAVRMTMEGLAKESGFVSRFTFIHAFKNQTGYSPKNYFAAIGRGGLE